jgi:N-acetylglucosaminyldiphosphoundecaprenol N-acetyl-beta-D-mannosaminyltransferase
MSALREGGRHSEKEGVTVGLLGGGKGVADKTAECLRKKYPGLKINFVDDGGKVDKEGTVFTPDLSSKIKCDLLFVAFGQVKQEMWIVKNMDQVETKVFMGVGGAFDYISGEVMRAPIWMRELGLEWLFRLIVQPWRIRRFGSLLQFLFLIVVC